MSTRVTSNSRPLQVALAAAVVGAAALLTAMGATGVGPLQAKAAEEEDSQTGEVLVTAMGNPVDLAATVTAASLTGAMATGTGASVTGGEQPAAQMYGRATVILREASQGQGQACCRSWCLAEVLQGP